MMQVHLENPIFPKADIRILMLSVTEKNDEPFYSADWHLPQISAILPLVRKVLFQLYIQLAYHRKGIIELFFVWAAATQLECDISC